MAALAGYDAWKTASPRERDYSDLDNMTARAMGACDKHVDVEWDGDDGEIVLYVRIGKVKRDQAADRLADVCSAIAEGLK